MVQHYDDVYMHTENIHYGNLEFRRGNTNELTLSESCNMLATIPTDVCHDTVTVTPRSSPKCTNELIFEENFKQPDYTNNWIDDIYMPSYDDKREEFVAYRNSKDDIYVADDQLHIKPTLSTENIRLKYDFNLGERCSEIHRCDPSFCSYQRADGFRYPPPVYSAKIHSKFSFMYGRIEIRAKLPKGDWLIPYIMLQNVNALRCESRYQAQLRVAFARGNDERSEVFNRGNILHGGPLLIKLKMKSELERKDMMTSYEYSKHIGDDFHNYTLIWGPESISVAIDGERYGCFRTDPQYFKDQFNIVLAVSAGGLLEFPERNLRKRNVRTERKVQFMNKPWGNSEPKASLNFYESFSPIKNLSQPWNDAAVMKIDYIRVYAI